MSLEIEYTGLPNIKPDTIPYGGVEQALAVAEIAWFLTTSSSRKGSDEIQSFAANQKDKKLVAVLVDKGKNRLLYNQGLTGVLINKPASVLTVTFEADGIPDYLNIDYNPDRVFFVWMKHTPKL